MSKAHSRLVAEPALITETTPTHDYFVLQRPRLSMCVCTLLTDVASMEQQQSAKDSSKEQEEEEREDIFMDVEEQEELKAVDTEQLKPEEVKSGITAGSGESYRKLTPPKRSDLEKLLLLYCILIWTFTSMS